MLKSQCRLTLAPKAHATNWRASDLSKNLRASPQSVITRTSKGGHDLLAYPLRCPGESLQPSTLRVTQALVATGSATGAAVDLDQQCFRGNREDWKVMVAEPHAAQIIFSRLMTSELFPRFVANFGTSAVGETTRSKRQWRIVFGRPVPQNAI